jgi:hypothetical protein
MPGKEEAMVTLTQVEDQLKKIGCNFRFWGRPEIRELCDILLPTENIAMCVNGRYEGGWALLVVTDHRLLLIDKKPMFLTLEDIRFDMISEIDYSARLLEATVHIITPNRKLTFSSPSAGRLRKLLNYTQSRVMEIRQHFMAQQLQIANEGMQDRAATLGGFIMQGSRQQSLPMNPYMKMPLLMRRRRYPKFY